ncbi:hypothetical protein [Demequina sp. SO4-18]|uniref:hypothetical protein n=1 Tax=Demequina sp. SO4-18 TaxID=3401026 RepID=UPI003B5A693C
MTVAPRVLPGHTWSMRIVMMMVSLVAAVVGGVFHAPAAAAHGGPYELEVHNDGAGGVQVFAYYVEDGHIVEAIMDPVVEAVSADGVERGPIRLISSAEGQGRWVSEEPFLEPGDWTVTVTTTTPDEASVTEQYTVAPFDPPAQDEPMDEPAEPQPSGSAATADDESVTDDSASTDELASTADQGGVGEGAYAWLIAAVVVVALAAALVAWRRSRR